MRNKYLFLVLFKCGKTKSRNTFVQYDAAELVLITLKWNIIMVSTLNWKELFSSSLLFLIFRIFSFLPNRQSKLI